MRAGRRRSIRSRLRRGARRKTAPLLEPQKSSLFTPRQLRWIDVIAILPTLGSFGISLGLIVGIIHLVIILNARLG
jgi:hypothetical protein